VKVIPVDMSPGAITTRLKRVAQLRAMSLRLAKGTLSPSSNDSVLTEANRVADRDDKGDRRD
jgi:hypothetical protein